MKMSLVLLSVLLLCTSYVLAEPGGPHGGPGDKPGATGPSSGGQAGGKDKASPGPDKPSVSPDRPSPGGGDKPDRGGLGGWIDKHVDIDKDSKSGIAGDWHGFGIAGGQLGNGGWVGIGYRFCEAPTAVGPSYQDLPSLD